MMKNRSKKSIILALRRSGRKSKERTKQITED